MTIENVTESIGVSTFTTGTPILSAAEQVGVSTSAHVAIRKDVSESLAVHAAFSSASWQGATASVGVHATSSAIVHAYGAAFDTIAVHASSDVRQSITVYESVGAHDGVGAIGISVGAVEHVAIHGALATYQTHEVALAESVGVRTTSNAGTFGFIVEAVGAHAQSTAVQTAYQHTLEAAGVYTTSWAELALLAVAGDSVGAHITGTGVSLVVAQLYERTFISIRPWAAFDVPVIAFSSVVPLSSTSVWTADGRTFGMSRYVGVPVSEWVEYAGVTFGAAPTGVYTRETDAPVSWVETAKMQFQTQFDSRPEHKRLSHVYVYAQSGQPLDITVSGDYQGMWVSQTYTQPTSALDTTRAVRTLVGRGFASNFYTFRIGSKPFDLLQFEVEMAKTSRRV